MADTYFEYTLSKCRSSLISTICTRFQTKQKLLKSLEEEWKGYTGLTSNSTLVRTINEVLRNENFIRFQDVLGDSKIIYDRCEESFRLIRDNWRKGNRLDYDRLFDTLVDFCWLAASGEHCRQSHDRTIILLYQQTEIRDSLREYLDSLYTAAIEFHNDSVYMVEGRNAKIEHPWVPSRYNNKYPESSRYINSQWTVDQLLDMQQQCKDKCSGYLTTYYVLTATAALANNIRRGLV